MRLHFALGAIAGSSISNALRFTNPNFYNISSGTPFNITWADAVGPVTLTLYKGATVALLEETGVIASGLTGSNYVWTPDTSLLRNIYNVNFKDSTDASINSFLFEIVRAPTTIATSTAVSATTTSAVQDAKAFVFPTDV